MTDLAISVTGLTQSFRGTSVLRGVDLDVRRGEILAVLGSNGAGKTTLIAILSTLLMPGAVRGPLAARRRAALGGAHHGGVATSIEYLGLAQCVTPVSGRVWRPLATPRRRGSWLLTAPR